MQISGFAWMLVLATAALSSQSASAATNTTKTPAYYCKTDDDCASWPNTVCITVEAKDPISKCTPNTVARPACRAGQFGLCPSYQDTSRGYLNAHCIFVADDSVAPATVTATTTTTTTAPAATTAARQLQTTTSPAATVKAAGSSSGSSTTTSATRAPLTVAPAEDTTTTTESSGSSDSTTTSGTSVGDSTSSGSDTMAAAVKSASYKIGNQTVYGIFKCADLSECDNLAADPTTCRPAKCGDSTSVEQCTNQGTCTHTSKQDIKMRSCMCYKGFSGTKCEKTESGECDVDCGQGGDCVDGECVCHAGFDGKKYKNKQGKADSRCTKCTSDLACENSNTCDIETGKCDCGAGYTGATCGGVEDDCVTLDCGVGMCQVVDTTATCMCPICDPECQKCPTKNCSTCPSAASSVTISIGAILVAVVASLMMG